MKSAQPAAGLLLTMPELVPELGTVRMAGAGLAAEGLGPEVLAGDRGQRAAARDALGARLTGICPPGPGFQDPGSQAQDDFFGVGRTLAREPAAVGLAFLLAHLEVLDDAEESGSGLPEAEWDALLAAATMLFGEGDGGEGLGPGAAVPVAGPPAGDRAAALRRWRCGHRLFFVVTQGIVSALSGTVRSVSEDRADEGCSALAAAAALSRGAAAALRFTADFPTRAYADTVRPSMMPPGVPPGFSGVQGPDHQVLVELYRRMRPVLTSLDPETWPIRAFQDATAEMFAAHVGVCDRFGGGEQPSILMEAHGHHDARVTATHVLDKLVRSRLTLLDSP
ncbi:hypothetical protein [Streptomyces prunicolor]